MNVVKLGTDWYLFITVVVALTYSKFVSPNSVPEPKLYWTIMQK